jgi:two-component system, OmpR family, response regulator
MMFSQIHILLVEDDAEIARGTIRFLTQSGFRVSHAQDARAMDKIMKDAKIDLLLLDLMLPGEDGLSICRRLRAAHTTPITMLTAMGCQSASRIDQVTARKIEQFRGWFSCVV